MVELEVALDLMDKIPTHVSTETIDLQQSLGRILAMNIIADRDYPPFNRSAMDGIAIRIEDFIDGKYATKIIETIYAGKSSNKKLGFKESYRIMTGAAVPEGANAVIQIEKLQFLTEYDVHFENLPNKWQNIAIKGEDIKKNKVLYDKNLKITPYLIGVLASLGYAKIEVVKPPKITIISTGDELVELDKMPNSFQIRASSKYVLNAMFQSWNISLIEMIQCKDDKKLIKETIENALSKSDLIITTGAVSAGDTDFLPQIFEEIGFEKLFHKVNIKPGKPIWAGFHSKENRMAFGLPGNPLSTQIGFILFVQKWLQLWFGLSKIEPPQYKIEKEIKRNPKLDVFYPAMIENENGIFKVLTIKNNGSGDVISTGLMQGFFKIPKGNEFLQKNEFVDWWDLS